MKVKLFRLVVGPLQTNCYILADLEGKKALIIDPGAESIQIFSLLEKLEIKKVEYIINTHGHFDHIGANLDIKKKFVDAKLIINKNDSFFLNRVEKDALEFSLMNFYKNSPSADILVKDLDSIIFLDYKFYFYHTPGHSPGSMIIYNKTLNIMFTGDTLFKESIGNYQLPFSDKYLLKTSLHKILDFPDSTKIYPGHGSFSNLGYERENNIVLISFFQSF